MKTSDNLMDEVKTLSEYTLDITVGIEDKPQLMLLRLEIVNHLTMDMIITLRKYLNEEQQRGIDEIVALAKKHIESGVVIL
jgi:hypothetical protein